MSCAKLRGAFKLDNANSYQNIFQLGILAQFEELSKYFHRVGVASHFKSYQNFLKASQMRDIYT